MTDMSLFQSPLSIILAAIFVTGIVMADMRLRTRRVYDILTGRRAAIAGVTALAAFMLTEGTWGTRLHHHPAFLAVMAAFIFVAGCTALRSFREARSWAFRLSHLGIFLTLAGGFLTGADIRDGMIRVTAEREEHYAFSSTGMTIPLPFQIRLEKMEIEYYDDHASPKQYTSHLLVDGRRMSTEVNSPCRHRGYLIYQSDCDREKCSYSILKVVHDPWLPVTFAGMALLAMSAILTLGGVWRGRWTWVVIAAGATAFTLISVARINFGTLMPALRSMWFVPHLAVYMIAYSMLAVSVVCGAAWWMRPRHEFLRTVSMSTLRYSSSLLLIGMLCGAVWAKYAWGDYWAWDPKECWAAVTWFLTIAATHVGSDGMGRRRLVVAFTILAFVAMQVTWYGVNYLPSAAQSMHTYNR